MPRGGARAGAGRKPKAGVPATVSKDEAQKILDFLALEKNPHPPTCRCLCCRWWLLANAFDTRLRFTVEQALLNRVLGLAPKAESGKPGEEDRGPGNLKVTVEFIGGADGAPAGT